MSTRPRISSALPDQEPTFANVTAHAPDMIARFFTLYTELWQKGIVPPELKELTRIRNARITDCGY
jgi:hypothetical protein|tara:strand:- start:839 stop:1036 length:198 start_codon:yes stop_codon:yes gene_type:complete